MRYSCDLGGGASVGSRPAIYQTLSRKCPSLCYARACMRHASVLFMGPCASVHLTYPFRYLLFCFLSFLYVVFILFLLLCSRWSFVDGAGTGT